MVRHLFTSKRKKKKTGKLWNPTSSHFPNFKFTWFLLSRSFRSLQRPGQLSFALPKLIASGFRVGSTRNQLPLTWWGLQVSHQLSLLQVATTFFSGCPTASVGHRLWVSAPHSVSGGQEGKEEPSSVPGDPSASLGIRKWAHQSGRWEGTVLRQPQQDCYPPSATLAGWGHMGDSPACRYLWVTKRDPRQPFWPFLSCSSSNSRSHGLLFLSAPCTIAVPIPETRNACSCLHIWSGPAWLQFKNLHVGPIPLLDKEILLTGGLICMSLPRMPTPLPDVSQTRGEERAGERWCFGNKQRDVCICYLKFFALCFISRNTTRYKVTNFYLALRENCHLIFREFKQIHAD